MSLICLGSNKRGQCVNLKQIQEELLYKEYMRENEKYKQREFKTRT